MYTTVPEIREHPASEPVEPLPPAERFTCPTWTLHTGACCLTVVVRGGVAVSWTVTNGLHDATQPTLELLDGYHDQAELEEGNGVRGALLVPWSNRIRDARYTFGGATYDRGPDAHGIREANHGLALTTDFEMVERVIGPRESYLRLAGTVGPEPGYPWTIQVGVTYSLACINGGSALTMELEATNVSDTPAPVGLGWHPYVRLGDVDGLSLDVPGRRRVLTDAAHIPLASTSAFAPVPCGSHERFVLAGHALDDAWTDLVAEDDGIVRTVLSSPTGSTITLEQRTATETPGVGVVQVFTGEGLAHRAREAVAIEPCMFMTDAFNREECAQAVPLDPGDSRVLDATLVYRS